MAYIKRFVKHPDEIVDYDVDFTSWLDARSDTINVYAVGATPGIDLVESTQVGGIIRTFVGGGSVGTAYRVAVEIETDGGRVKRGEIEVRVQGDDSFIPFVDGDFGETFVDANDG